MNPKKLTCLLLALALCLSLAACGKEPEPAPDPMTVCLVNRTGEPISAVHITSAASDEWGESVLDAPLEDGEMVTVSLGARSDEELAAGFNILTYNADDTILYDTSVDEMVFPIADGDFVVFLPPNTIPCIDVTAAYDASYYDFGDEEPEPEAEEEDFSDSLDITPYAGSWKYDDEPIYLVITDSYEWVAVNLYGERIGPGMVTVYEDCIALCNDSGEELLTLSLAGDGQLLDGEGSYLTYNADMMLLPTQDDELDQTAWFPSDFSNVSVDYPSTMSVHDSPTVTNALSFNAVLEEGTEDYWSNILLAFQPIEGFDPYMTQGLGNAKPYLEKMLNDFLSTMYGDYILKTISSECIDCGSYYSITGYVWMDGSIFAESADQPVRGVMEVRYYGPTGYALVSMSLALESRIQNYYEISKKLLETCSYDAGWTTSPKEVPAQPAQPSDSGDYGTPYYWYDEDGDVWYWNGYENEFIGFGDSYYIEDGQYYESNDAGWDYEDEGWGDYVEDYDPWSDPGDGWGDYGDYDGWGDYFG